MSGKIKFETNQFQTQHFQVLFKTHKKQEFIKVGCVPPASVAISGAGGGVSAGGGSAKGVCLPPVNRMTDRQVSKHYLPITSFVDGKYL